MSNEPVEVKKCIACDRTRPITSFHKNSNYESGRDSRCKICKTRGITKHPHKHITKEKDRFQSGFKLNGVKDYDFCQMWKLLRDIGYDTDTDIHQQFVDKYGLKYKKRPYRNNVRLQPNDCE